MELSTNSSWLLLALHAVLAVSAPSPQAVKWHDTAIGPDGPWNAVEVKVGSSSDPVALFPGRTYQSYVITSDYCAYNTSISHCEAGTYSKDTAIEEDLAGIGYQPEPQEAFAGMEIVGRTTKMFMDTFDLGFEGGEVSDTSFALLESQMIRYPGGGLYPLFAGNLGLGASSMNQSFSQDDPEKQAINASLVPWYLSEHDTIPSSSFGMHIGSAASTASIKGSLLFGGYDRNRIIGDVLTLDGVFTDDILLKDIGIKVIKGDSPFGFKSKDGLLSGGNDTLSKGLNVRLDPTSPYLTLPKSACDSVAKSLPLQYNSSLGLYLWDTKSSKYDQIVRSASVLTFTFESDDGSLSINIPFQHLNLTLDSPLVIQSAPYFPCSTGGTGTPVLGRAFFQDAFLGANWEKKTWWLAQAPGPKSEFDTNVVSILSGDTSVYSGSSDWDSTWDDTWKGLSDKSPSDDNGHDKQADPKDPESPGLSTGAKAGIGVGAAAGALILGGLVFLLWRRKSRKEGSKTAGQSDEVSHISSPFDPYQYGKTYYQPTQPDGSDANGYSAPSELPSNSRYTSSWAGRQSGSTRGAQELP